jgi:redox-sensitive bicupin YhaK (pirin superfamily)
MATRRLQQLIPGLETSDGAGVRLRRSIGRSAASRLDPFLMLDEFASNDPGDYLAGFPPHPHRGFETVTYMLEGHMRHEDHLGHRGELRSGGVQWMTAGRGIVHSEMPQQESGRMHGFQLWINLPAAEKLKPAGYRDIPAAQIPVATLPGGVTAKVIAGVLRADATTTRGPIQGLSTDPLMIDLALPAGAAFSSRVPADYTACLYVYAGALAVGADGQALAQHTAGVLSAGALIELRAAADGSRALLLAARPLREPVVQYGPFVMNTRAEINQAIADFSSGAFAQQSAGSLRGG